MDYLELGPTPTDEPCATVDNPRTARLECRAYAHQLERILEEKFGVDYAVTLRIKSFPHDFGNYLEVIAVWHDEESGTQAFWLENNLPSLWDAEAKAEMSQV